MYNIILFSCRNGYLQLDEGVVTVNQVGGGGDMGQGIILASTGDYLAQKDGTTPQFASFNIVDGQVSQDFSHTRRYDLKKPLHINIYF